MAMIPFSIPQADTIKWFNSMKPLVYINIPTNDPYYVTI